MSEVKPSNERLLSALMGDVELEEHEKISQDEAQELIRSMGDFGLTVDEAVRGIQSICNEAHKAGIPNLVMAELRVRRRRAFWRSIVSLAVGGTVLLGLIFFTLWVMMG